jgi:formylglycine-generating enzyme required for sulfatase activity
MSTDKAVLAAQAVTFETVTVDERGTITARTRCTGYRVTEPLPAGVTLELVAIPAGGFLMGSLPGQGFEDERPLHSVRLPAFWLGQYPVTQAQWQAVMGRLPPCRGRGPHRPVDRVSWHAAQAFCRRLAELTGRAYRLPSEAEWEYACRAGTTTPFYVGETLTTGLANYVGLHLYRAEPEGVYRHGTTDVGTFPPNAFGLYDMHGNVWEWCADAWHDDYTGAPPDGQAWKQRDAAVYVLRGGCWHDPPGLCRSAARLRQRATEGEDYFGFRVALSSLELSVETRQLAALPRRLAGAIRSRLTGGKSR